VSFIENDENIFCGAGNNFVISFHRYNGRKLLQSFNEEKAAFAARCLQ